MSELISKEKVVRLINEAIDNANKEFFDSEWARGEVNGLGVARDIILSGQCEPDPVPTIKPGDKEIDPSAGLYDPHGMLPDYDLPEYLCPCGSASSQQEWDEETDRYYGGDTATIHDAKALSMAAYFICPVCGCERDINELEVVKDE